MSQKLALDGFGLWIWKKDVGLKMNVWATVINNKGPNKLFGLKIN